MIPRARSGQSNHFHALVENPVEASMQTLPLMKKQGTNSAFLHLINAYILKISIMALITEIFR